MSDTYNYEEGAIHHDHKKVLHIDSVNGDDVGKLISAFFKDDAEEAEIVGEVGEKRNKVARKKKTSVEKPPIPRETMTFKRKSRVLEGHLSLLFDKLAKAGWILGEEGNFKALFSGGIDEECQLIWTGKYGKGTLVELFKQMVATTLIIVPDGFTLPAILEGHFTDADGNWLTGLNKGNDACAKALPFIYECMKLLKADPKKLVDGSYQDDEEFKAVYDSFDHQDLMYHKGR